MTKRSRDSPNKDKLLSKQRRPNDVENIRPYEMKGGLGDWPASRLWTGDHALHNLATACGSASVQVMVSQSSNFEGDMEGRELRQMAFSEFLEPPASGSPEYQHFLAQVPIWTCNCPQTAPLKALLPYLVLPAYLDPASSTCLQSINFWMASRKGSNSSLHYDPNHNFLCVVQGEKTVRLFSPAASPHLSPKPFWGQSSNHSRLDCRSRAAREQSPLKCAIRHESIYILKAGDVLFIPEGYWHQVDSGGGTIAVNIWFESVVSTMVLESDMSEFYLTRLLQSKAADKAQECLENIPCHPDLKAYCSRGAFPGQNAELESMALGVMLALQGDDSEALPTGYGNIFKALPASSLLRVLRLLSKDHPEALSRMLWALNPASTALLTQAFQSVEQEPDSQAFFQDLYKGVDDLDGLERRMIRSEESFSKQAAAAFFAERLGR